MSWVRRMLDVVLGRREREPDPKLAETRRRTEDLERRLGLRTDEMRGGFARAGKRLGDLQ